MSESFQTTLKKVVACAGVGLHSGKPVRLTLRPAGAETGIVFRRMDVVEKSHSFVAAHYLNVTETRLGTTITNEHGISVSTIEHLMAALWGCGVDNAYVELDGPEVPIMDGSSDPFVTIIESAGVQALESPRAYIEVLKNVMVREGESVLSIGPADGFAVNIEIDFDHAVIARQHSEYDFSDVTFKQALSKARTFGFEHEVEQLRKLGLARGGSLENAIVIGADRVLNEEGLRYNDEFVRHKALDCVGDLFLAGARLRGYVTAYRPGHGINNKLLRALLADRSAWRMVAVESVTVAPQPVMAREEAVAAYY